MILQWSKVLLPKRFPIYKDTDTDKNDRRLRQMQYKLTEGEASGYLNSIKCLSFSVQSTASIKVHHTF